MGYFSDLIERANKDIRIEDVLNDYFDCSVPYGIDKIKDYCPLGFDHSDGGVRKALTVYGDSNTAWCFSHSMRFEPVSLWQIRTGMKSGEAARDLLNVYGHRTSPLTLSERWEKAEQKQSSPPIDRDALRDLVLNKAASLPMYSKLQYDDSVVKAISYLLRSVDNLPDSADYGTIIKWKASMDRTLEEFWESLGKDQQHG